MIANACAFARAKLANAVNALKQTTTDKIVAATRTFAIAGTRTLVKDAITKTINALGAQGLKTAVHIPLDVMQAVARASFAKTFQGKEFAPDVYRTMANTLTPRGIELGKIGFDKGWQQTLQAWQNSGVASQVAADGFQQMDYGNPLVNRIMNVPGQLISATQRPWYEMTAQLSLYNDAKLMAMHAGLKGDAASAFVNQLLANPTEEMALAAARRGAEAVFSNPTNIGTFTQWARNGPRNLTGPAATIYRIAANTLIPVAKVPGAVLTQGLVDYSPLGAVIRPLLANLPKSDALEGTTVAAIGNASIGSALIALGYAYGKEGMITGPQQASRAQGNITDATGAGEQAIKIAGQWVALRAVLGPFAPPLAVGAGIAQLKRDTRKPDGNPYADAAATAGQIITEETFLENFQRVAEAAKHGDPSSIATSLVPVPQILRQTSNAVAGGATRVKEGFGQKVLSDIVPGYARGLPVKRDVFGKPMMRTQGGVLGAAQEFLDPTLTRLSKSTPVTDELQRLGVGIATAGKKLSMPGGEPLERSAANRNAGRAVVGPFLEKMLTPIVTSPGYATAPDDVKRKILERVVARGHKIDQQLARAAGVQARRAQP